MPNLTSIPFETTATIIRREEVALRKSITLLSGEAVELGHGFATIDATLEAHELRKIADALDRIDDATPPSPGAAA